MKPLAFIFEQPSYLPTGFYKISFYNIIKCFWAFSQRSPVTNHAVLYDVWNVKLQLYAKGLVWSRGGGSTSVKLFLFSICWIAKTEFTTHIFNWYLSNEKTAFVDKSSVEPTIFFIEKYHFLWNFSLVYFMGNPSLMPRSHIHGMDAGLAMDTIRHHSWQSVWVRSFPYCIRNHA